MVPFLRAGPGGPGVSLPPIDLTAGSIPARRFDELRGPISGVVDLLNEDAGARPPPPGPPAANAHEEMQRDERVHPEAYSREQEAGGIRYFRRDWNGGQRRGFEGFYPLTLIYENLPGVSLRSLEHHGPSRVDWDSLLSSGAEFVVQTVARILAVKDDNQVILKVPMVPFTVRAGAATSMAGLMRRVAEHFANAIEVARFESSGMFCVP